jgi:CheY-like chemotaxis protein
MSPKDVILLVEDNEEDIILLRRAFLRARVLNPLLVVRDAEEAVYYLEGTGRYANRAEFPVPSVMLLDLKLPGMGGLDLLRWVRDQPGIGHVRVIVLTSSERITDVNQAYQLGASSFLVKPADLDSLIQIMAAFRGHWLWLHDPAQFTAAQTSEGKV